MKEAQQTEGFVCPEMPSENHLRHRTEIVQTTELRVIPTVDIVNLSFVFTMASLRDPSNLFSTCQGMILAFILRFRLVPNDGGGTLTLKTIARGGARWLLSAISIMLQECKVPRLLC